MRKIIHIDMDAFFAAIEMRDTPELATKPIAVGGNPQSRGVVATANYRARGYGIHSAMAMANALKRCPDLVIIAPRISVYRQVSQQIRGIFFRFSEKIEPLSIDEAYLDVSNNYDFQGSATLLAAHIIKTIEKETQLSASAGVSYCKFLAKYASNINKPNGIFTITPENAQAIIDAMAVEEIHGIGPATQKKLNGMGVFTGKDLRSANLVMLKKHLGKNAEFYYDLAHGKDNREVRVSRVRKSLGNEVTFAKDISNNDELWARLQQLLHKTWRQMDKQNLCASTLTIKIKFYDFSLQTKRYTERAPIETLATASLISQTLLNSLNLNRAVRLIGISFSQFSVKNPRPRQPRLFD